MDILFLILFTVAVAGVIYFDMKDRKQDSKSNELNKVDEFNCSECSKCPFSCKCDKCTLNEDKQEENFDKENEKNIKINYNDTYLGQESIYDKEEEYEYYSDDSEEFKYDLDQEEEKENDWDLYTGYWNK